MVDRGGGGCQPVAFFLPAAFFHRRRPDPAPHGVVKKVFAPVTAHLAHARCSAPPATMLTRLSPDQFVSGIVCAKKLYNSKIFYQQLGLNPRAWTIFLSVDIHHIARRITAAFELARSHCNSSDISASIHDWINGFPGFFRVVDRGGQANVPRRVLKPVDPFIRAKQSRQGLEM